MGLVTRLFVKPSGYLTGIFSTLKQRPEEDVYSGKYDRLILLMACL
jgi:hypothetical protein